MKSPTKHSLKLLLLLGMGAVQAGTWTTVPWSRDSDISGTEGSAVTHAIAFGLELESPLPAPFELSNKRSGENWSVWKMPGHTADVIVTKRPEQMVKRDEASKGEGGALQRGRIIAKGNGWLTLELRDLDPGKKYILSIFGLSLITPKTTVASMNVLATASDAPDKQEALPLSSKHGTYFSYEYTAPADGELALTFAGDETNPEIRQIRFCAFLNAPAD